jgi:hypothetical protein
MSLASRDGNNALFASLEGFKKDPFSNMIKSIIVFKEGILAATRSF